MKPKVIHRKTKKVQQYKNHIVKEWYRNATNELIPREKSEVNTPGDENELLDCGHCEKKYKRNSYLEKHKLEAHGIRAEARNMLPKMEDNISSIKIEDVDHIKVEFEANSLVQSLAWKKGTTENNSFKEFLNSTNNQQIDTIRNSN